MTVLQPLFENGDLVFHIAGIAFNEDGARRTGQPADTGPRCHLRFGDEIDVLARIECENIKPGPVIGHHSSGYFHPWTTHHQRKTHDDKGGPAHCLRDIGRDRTVDAENRPLDQAQQEHETQPSEHHKGQNEATQNDAQPSCGRDAGLGDRVVAVPGGTHDARRVTRSSAPAVIFAVSRMRQTSVVLKAWST